MPPVGNFDETLPLPPGGAGINASGPLQNLSPGRDSVKSLYVWVEQLQDDGSCAAATGEVKAPDPNDPDGKPLPLDRWEVQTELEGAPTAVNFIEGPAIAFAIAIFDEDGKQKVFWWGQNITLKRQ
jgi:hypothetical protein